MMHRWKLLRPGAALWVGLAGFGTLMSEEVQEAKIPTLHGTALNGEAVDLGRALSGKVGGILVIGFSQASREQVTNWGKRLAADYQDSPAILYYEMPVLVSVPRILRGWVTGKIRSTVPLPAQSRFVPIEENDGSWKNVARYKQTESDEAYVLVVDGEGMVRSRVHGAPTDPVYANVRNQMEQLRLSASSGTRR